MIELMLQIVAGMIAEKWKPNPRNRGGFGAEFDKRLCESIDDDEYLSHNGRYKTYPNVVTDEHGIVKSIGDATGNKKGDVQFDALRYDGKLEVGDRIKPEKVVDDYEFKTGKAGNPINADTQAQLKKRTQITGKAPKLVKPPYRWDGRQIAAVPEAVESLKAAKALKHLGSLFSALALLSLYNTEVSASEVRQLVRSREACNGLSDVFLWSRTDLDRFLNKFVEDGASRFAITLYVYKLEEQLHRQRENGD